MTEDLEDSMKNKILDKIPAQKFGNPSDIAFLALFLASNEASYINGQTISVDGGLFMS
jgi:3-oxoacyl-[acyl-carrier protein] reductase